MASEGISTPQPMPVDSSGARPVLLTPSRRLTTATSTNEANHGYAEVYREGCPGQQLGVARNGRCFTTARRQVPLVHQIIEPPHVRYSVAALKRHGEVHGYAVYRHRHEPLGRVTMLVDFLADPDDVSGIKTLLRWVDRAARAEDRGDRVVPVGLPGVPQGDGAALLGQMRAAQMIGEVGRGKPQQLVDEAHARSIARAP